MSGLRRLKESFTRRLVASARGELFGHFHRTISEYEEELGRKRRLLELVFRPEQLRRTDVQQLLVRRGGEDREDQEDREDREDQEDIKQEQQEVDISVKTLEEEELVSSHRPLRDSDSSETDVSEDDGGHGGVAPSDGPAAATRDRGSFVCSYCGKRFCRKGNLEIHQRTHTGERPFGCPFCDKRFTTRLILRMHESVHTGDKRFQCSVCGKKFNWHSQVRCHKCVRRQDQDCGPDPPWLRLRHPEPEPEPEDRTQDSSDP